VEDEGNPLGLHIEEMMESLCTLFYMAKNLNVQINVAMVKKGNKSD
jgi:GTPase